MKLSMLVDPSKCVGCHACEVACMQEHSSSRPMVRVEEVEAELGLRYVPVVCRHCGRPPCVEVCPTEALRVAANGVVVLDASRCIGCGACIPVCPFKAIGYDPDRGVATKCDMCMSRVGRGLPPSCVAYCPTGALRFGDLSSLASDLRRESAKAYGGSKP